MLFIVTSSLNYSGSCPQPKLATFAARCIENEILMHLRSEADDVIKEVDLKIEKSKIYCNLDILDDREKEVVVGRFGLDTGGEERN